MSEQTTETESTVVTKKKSKTGLIIGIAVAVLLIVGIALFLIIFNLGSTNRKVKKQLDLGEKFLTELDYDNAILAYKEAISIDPNRVELYLDLAEAYHGAIDQCKAEENYEKALEYVDDAIVDMEEGVRNTDSEEVKEALEEFKEEKEEIEDLSKPGKRPVPVKRIDYNAAGEIVTEIIYEYDENGHTSKVIEYGRDHVLRVTREIESDSDGNVVKQTSRFPDKGDYNVTEYEDGKASKFSNYDAQGNLTDWTQYCTDEFGLEYFEVHTLYNGQWDTSINYPNGQTMYDTTPEYDDEGRLIKENKVSAYTHEVVTYEYDEAGNLAKKTMVETNDETGDVYENICVYQYDEYGNPLTEEWTYNGAPGTRTEFLYE